MSKDDDRQLATLARLRARQTQSAAARLRKIEDECRRHGQLLGHLQAFRGDYSAGLRQATGRVVTGEYLNNMRRALDQADRAIAAQRQLVEQAEQGREAGRQQWLAERQQQRALEALLREQRQKRLRQAAENEQAEVDDLVASRRPTGGHGKPG